MQKPVRWTIGPEGRRDRIVAVAERDPLGDRGRIMLNPSKRDRDERGRPVINAYLSGDTAV